MTRTTVDPWEAPTDHEAKESRRLLEARYALAVERVTGVVYEAGCGRGYGTSLLAQVPLVTKVTARDFDAKTVGIAVQHPHPKVNLGVGNIEQEAVPPCDWVVCTEVMDLLHLPEVFLTRIKRVARIGILLSWPVGKSGPCPGSEFQVGQMAEWMADWHGTVRTLHERGPGGRILANYELGAFERTA